MTVETRYFRSDTHTINGLTAYKLLTTNTESLLLRMVLAHIYIGIRVWKRSSAGVETEITDGIVRALARITGVLSLQSGSWACPQTSLATTDAIVVRVYVVNDENVDPVLMETFITAQVGATQLDAATWTVYYWVVNWADEYGILWSQFIFGSSAFNSRIENFTWTLVPVVLGDGLTWVVG